MHTQYLERQISCPGMSDAFESQRSDINRAPYQLSLNSIIVTFGCTQAIRNLNMGQVGAFALDSSLRRDRRKTCRILSRAYWHSVWLLSPRLAHNRRRTSTLWSIRRRSRSSPFLPASTAESTEPSQCDSKIGQAVRPVQPCLRAEFPRAESLSAESPSAFPADGRRG